MKYVNIIYNNMKESWYSEKLELKWKGLYIIATILFNRTYKIADQGGYYVY